MATRGTPIPAVTLARLRRLAAQGVPLARIARELGVSRRTVQKYRPAPLRRAV